LCYQSQRRTCRYIYLFTVVFMGGFVTSAAQAGHYLGELTWPQAQHLMPQADAVILPFGAGAKEHGPHLPMNADAQLMQYLLTAAVAEKNVIVAPPILHGWFPAFRGWPGTEVEDVDVFAGYVKSVAESLAKQKIRRLILLNTGIARATGLPLTTVARDLRVDYGIPVLVVSWDDIETDEVLKFSEQRRGGHADELETSVHLVLQPNLVQMDKAVVDYRGEAKPRIGYAPGVFSRDPNDADFSDTGVFGDATLASKEKGERVLAIMKRNWLQAIDHFVAP